MEEQAQSPFTWHGLDGDDMSSDGEGAKPGGKGGGGEGNNTPSHGQKRRISVEAPKLSEQENDDVNVG